IGQGNQNPTAQEVADLTGMSIRTVFRQIDDMEGLYRGLTERLEADVLPIINAPFKSSTDEGRMSEFRDRRARVFEFIMPFRVAAEAKAVGSEQLMRVHETLILREQRYLDAALPAHALADKSCYEALLAIHSFAFWKRLRVEQKASARTAKKTVAFCSELLIEKAANSKDR
ncbi:MAG: hypothetical protein AAGI28_09105, partial [Pseudomonadota bacterium]